MTTLILVAIGAAMFGGTLGYFTCALMVMAKDSDERGPAGPWGDVVGG